MNKKLINKKIRKISTSTTLPVLAFLTATYIIKYPLLFTVQTAPADSILRDTGFLNFILYTLLYVICIPLIVLVFQKVKGNKVGIKISSLYKKPQKSAFWCFKWIIITMGFSYIASIVSNIIFTIIETATGITFNEASFNFGDSIFGIITIVIAPIIFAPIFEELLFRGVVFKNSEPLGQWFAIIMSGLLFGLWHENHPQFLFAAVMGCFSAFMVAKTRSVIPSMIAHFLINSISTVVQVFISFSDIDINNLENEILTGDNKFVFLLTSLAGMLIMGVIIAAIVFFAIETAQHKGKANLIKSIFNIETPSKIVLFMCSPVTLITFALMILETILNAIPSAYI